MDNKFPPHIMKKLRRRLGLSEGDTHMDEVINRYNPRKALREVVAWELGDPDWADAILSYADYCGYEVKVGDEDIVITKG